MGSREPLAAVDVSRMFPVSVSVCVCVNTGDRRLE